MSLRPCSFGIRSFSQAPATGFTRDAHWGSPSRSGCGQTFTHDQNVTDYPRTLSQNHFIGFTGVPLTITVTCRWQPVDQPVVPTYPTTSPRPTRAPGPTR